MRRALVLILLGAFLAPAWAATREEQLKAAIVYNFLKFIEWPASSDTIRVGILGKNPLDAALKGLQGRSVGASKVEVVSLANLDQARSVNCVYVGPSRSGELAKILGALGNQTVLTVSDIPRFAEQGGALGLYREGDNIRFSANLKSLKSSKLKVSSRLLSVAKIVDGSKALYENGELVWLDADGSIFLTP